MCNQLFYTTYEKGDSMDARLQKIADTCKEEFGLSAYKLESYSIHKERNSRGEAYYKFNMEFFPIVLTEGVEDDLNPDGTAIIEYNIQREMVESVVFVAGTSLATKSHFVEKTVDEVAKWVESETGLIYEIDFTLSEVSENGFRFNSDVDGIQITPAGIIEVEFDESGKLTSYNLYDTIPTEEYITKSQFTLTLEEIEPLVKGQLQLVEFPMEAENRFAPVYAMEEVYIPMDGSRIIPFMEHERLEVEVNQVMEWDVPLIGELPREELNFSSEVSADEAFGNIGDEEKLVVTDEQVEQCKIIVRNVLRTELPKESGVWKFATLQRHENFIEAVCRMNDTDSSFFNRKLVVLINPQTLAVVSFLDNGQMFEIFDTFAPAEKAVVSHEEAFEKLLSYISLEPTYVFDEVTGKYILCGLLDAAEGIDAVTGEVVSLTDY